MIDESEFLELATVFGLVGRNVRKYVAPQRLRQVANNCRYPNINFGLRQYFGMTLHTAGAPLSWLMLGYLNAYGYQEIQGAGSLQIAYGLEYPIGRDDLQIFYFNGSEFGQCTPGGVVFTDGLWLDTLIPKGAQFKLWTYIYSTASGIPGSYSGPQPFVNGAATYGLAIQSGSNTTSIDYFLQNTTAAQRNALANNSTANGNVQITPMCILSDANVRAFGLWGDSRSAGQSAATPWNFDYVSDTSLKQCALERVFGDLAPWINFSASSDSMGNMTTSGGARRNEFLKFVTDVVNGLGTNDIDGAASDAALQALDAAFASLKYVAGKNLWGTTLPPKASASTDQFITTANQTASAGATRRLNLNTWRKTASIYTKGVIDYAPVVSDSGTSLWTARGVATTGAMTVGSNSVALGSAVATAAMAGKTAYVTGAGTSAAALIARIQYVNASTITLVDAVTGAAVNCVTAVSGVVVYLNCREFTTDGIHETQYAGMLYETNLKPVAAALF